MRVDSIKQALLYGVVLFGLLSVPRRISNEVWQPVIFTDGLGHSSEISWAPDLKLMNVLERVTPEPFKPAGTVCLLRGKERIRVRVIDIRLDPAFDLTLQAGDSIEGSEFNQWENPRESVCLVRGKERIRIGWKDICSDPSFDLELQPDDTIEVRHLFAWLLHN